MWPESVKDRVKRCQDFRVPKIPSGSSNGKKHGSTERHRQQAAGLGNQHQPGEEVKRVKDFGQIWPNPFFDVNGYVLSI